MTFSFQINPYYIYGEPQFCFWILIALAKICFSLIVTSQPKIQMYLRQIPPKKPESLGPDPRDV